MMTSTCPSPAAAAIRSYSPTVVALFVFSEITTYLRRRPSAFICATIPGAVRMDRDTWASTAMPGSDFCNAADAPTVTESPITETSSPFRVFSMAALASSRRLRSSSARFFASAAALASILR